MPTQAEESIDAFQQYYRQPKVMSKKESMRQFLWDPATHKFFGRTGPEWTKIGIFYLAFYGVLAALVSICMWVFFQTINPRVPKWQLTESIIGTNPGLGFRPLPPEDNVESTLIWYRGTNYENFQQWTESLDQFLAAYKTPGITTGSGQNIHDCSYTQRPGKGQICNVNVNNWKPCTQENYYSYHRSSPCVFLKLNKIYNWIPDYYNSSSDLPTEMPQDLKSLIKKEEEETPHRLDTVWVSCEGENPADLENVGSIKYYPQQGFPGYFYPYQNTEGYLSPLVAVHFERPVRGIIINIECKAWAKNIKHDRKDKIGSVHFELMID